MEEEDSEVFEITDFTTASEWERFIAQLEEVLHEWKLVNTGILPPIPKGEYAAGEWDERSEVIQFADFKFTITQHYLKQEDETENVAEDQEDAMPTVLQDLQSSDNDFPSRAHCLCRWYGLRSFVVICPSLATESLSSESRSNLLLSSLAVAVNSTGCQVPMFVQVHQKWRRLYHGIAEFPGIRTNFEMVHLKRLPNQYSHLSGLLDIFKAKIACPISPLPPVNVAVRFTYVLQDWMQSNWPQSPPDMDSMTAGEVGCAEFGKLPFGACEDPVSELHMSSTWPNLSEEMVVDNDVYTDLDPLQAPQWSVRVRMTDDPQCLLGEYLAEFVQLCGRTESTDQLLGTAFEMDDADTGPDMSQALQRLTEPAVQYKIPSLSSMMGTTNSRLKMKPEDAPIPGDVLNQILVFLFPDAKSDKTKPPAAEDDDDDDDDDDDEEKKDNVEDKELYQIIKDQLRQFKSCPPEDLTFRLAVSFCIINHSYGGLRAVAHLWQEFVLEMRYRWENNYTLPDVSKGSPNLGHSLLQQKIQMLNCCVDRKKSREAQQLLYGITPDTAENTEGTSPTSPSTESLADMVYSSDEDEFFECDEDVLEKESKNGEKSGKSDNKGKKGVKSLERKDSKEAKSKSDGTAAKGVARKEKKEGKNGEKDKGAAKRDRKKEAALKGNGAKGSKEKGAKGKSKEDDDDEKDVDTSEKSDKKRKRSEEEEDEKDDDDDSGWDQWGEDMDDDDDDDDNGDDDEESSKGKEEAMETDVAESEMSFTDSMSYQPEGRLRQCGSLNLQEVDEILYIPVTQEPAPMTEDMLEQHAEVLAKLGTSAEGAQLRARMQSACLLSDMESFKAANPGCTLGDFVRWYSPRDWEEEQVQDGKVIREGQLSQRMTIPGNMWVEVWNSAKAVPARRQKRLFDDTKEAEKVLHYLASMKPAQVILNLMPMLIHAAIRRICLIDETNIPSLKALLKQITNRAVKVLRSAKQDVKKYEDLVRQLSLVEIVIARAHSLRAKFDEPMGKHNSADLEAFVSSLLEQPEVPIPGAAKGPTGRIIHKLFAAAQKSSNSLLDEGTSSSTPPATPTVGKSSSSSSSSSDFPEPTAREYILRTTLPRPAPYSRALPQRMFCVLIDEDYRLAGAFSSDTTFM